MNYFSRNISLKDQAYVLSKFSFLIKSGVSLTESLKIIETQAVSKHRHLFTQIIHDVSRGVSLSESMRIVVPRWSAFVIHLVHIGELTGTLGLNLEYVAHELKKRQELKQKIIGALMYPLCIGLATIGVTSLITLYILPKITPLFSGTDAVSLPASTRLLLLLNWIIEIYGLFIVCGVSVSFSILFVVWKKYVWFRIWCMSFVLYLPVGGSIIRSYEMSQMCRTLHVLLKSDISLPQALTYISSGCIAEVYSREYLVACRHVLHGGSLSSFIQQRNNTQLFPRMISQMFQVGESSGNMKEVSLHVSEYYEKELSQLIKNMSGLVEPILMVVMGFVVGFVAIAVISPIYEITQNIGR